VVVADGFDADSEFGTIKWGDFDIQDNSSISPYHALARKWNGVNQSGQGNCLNDEGACLNIVDQFMKANRSFQCTLGGSCNGIPCGEPWACCTGQGTGCDKIYVNHLSASDGAAPYFYASGHGGERHADDRLWTGWTRGTLGTCGTANYCLPEHEYPSLNCGWENPHNGNRTCSVYFEGLNVLAMHYINNNRWIAPGENSFWGLPARMLRTGIVYADFPGKDLISAIIDVNWRRFHGDEDVGVIPEGSFWDRNTLQLQRGGCDKPENTVQIHTDDEDDGNLNSTYTGGWKGAIDQDSSGTTLTVCRVDGSKLRPWSAADGIKGDYAVLKLGRKCPKGSREFQIFSANERTNNDSYIKGDAWPNRQNAGPIGSSSASSRMSSERRMECSR
jgi:hypothetical protein